MHAHTRQIFAQELIDVLVPAATSSRHIISTRVEAGLTKLIPHALALQARKITANTRLQQIRFLYTDHTLDKKSVVTTSPGFIRHRVECYGEKVKMICNTSQALSVLMCTTHSVTFKYFAS